MKTCFTLLLSLCAFTLFAQQDTATSKRLPSQEYYSKVSFIPTLSIGFVDAYRNNYSLPQGFVKNNTSGFAPLYLKVEYGLTRSVGIAATLCYDAFNYNFSQQYVGNNGPFIRIKTDAFRSFSTGLAAFYHLGNVIRVNRLDPFVGVGLAVNNIRYNAYPQGDSLSIRKDHTTGVYLKVGARYYISRKVSVYGDAGYDDHTILNLGVSCRFLNKSKK
jgi:hypothetical protein